jgi:hypothetical protein
LIEAQVAIMQLGPDDYPGYMIFLVKAGIDPISADLDSVASDINATRPETRGSPDRARLEKVTTLSQKLGFAVQKHKIYESHKDN